MSFFPPNVNHQRTWNNEKYFHNQFKHIWFKHFTLKIMEFENVALTKLVHIYVVEGMNA
jgi:hypothetical protein